MKHGGTDVAKVNEPINPRKFGRNHISYDSNGRNGNGNQEDYINSIVTLDPRGIVLARVEDTLLQWLQAIGIFFAGGFIIISVVDNGKKRKWYAIVFFLITVILMVVVFWQFIQFRDELNELNIKEPIRLDFLLAAIIVGAITIAIITIDHIFGDITK